MVSQFRRTSSGPFTSTAVAVATAYPVIGVQLALRFQRSDIRASKAHLVHVSTLASPSIRSYPASYAEDTDRGIGYRLQVSCCLSAAGVRFLDHLVPTGELGLPHGRLTEHQMVFAPQPGLPRSARVSCDRGGCPLCPGTVVLSRSGPEPSRHLPLLSGQSCSPATASHRRR